MGDRASDGRNRVAVLANRLRLVQLDFADHDAESRQQYMAEEIERALSGVHPDERHAFLTELRDSFPSWDANVALPATPVAEAPAARTRTDERELQDPTFLVGRLCELAPMLSGREREQIISELRSAGLSPVSRHDWPEEATDDLRKAIKLQDSVDLDPARVVELAALMTSFAISLERISWRTWKMVSGRSSIRPPAVPMDQAVGKFAQGDQRIAHAHIKEDLEKLRKVIASLVSVIGRFGPLYAQEYMDLHSPEIIERNAARQKGLGKEAKCWRQYLDIMARRDQRTVEMEITELLAREAEKLMGGAMP